MSQSHINMTINGNITKEPELKKIGTIDAIVFSVAVNTNEKDAAVQGNDAFITNFYEVTYYPSKNDSFMSKAQRGTEITLNGKGWMYSYVSKKDNCTKYGLKFRASSYFLGARQKGEARTTRPAAPEEDYANL